MWTSVIMALAWAVITVSASTTDLPLQATSSVSGASTVENHGCDCHNVSYNDLSIPLCPNENCSDPLCPKPTTSTPSCKCDAACVVFGDCCPQDTYGSLEDGGCITSHRFQRSSFRCSEVKTKMSLMFEEKRNYLLIASCPTEWADDDTRWKCENMSSAELSMVDVPVNQEGVGSFKNIFCAVCNGITADYITPWKVTLLDCDIYTFKMEQTFSIKKAVNESGCTLSVDPPNYISHGPILTTCSSYMSQHVEACMFNTDDLISQACSTLSVESILYENNLIIYENYGTFECSPAGIPSRLKYFQCPCWNSIRTTQPISVLFDFSSGSGVRLSTKYETVTAEAITCISGKAFDPFTGNCLTLTCPQGSKLYENECVWEDNVEDGICKILESTNSSMTTIAFVSERDSCSGILDGHFHNCTLQILNSITGFTRHTMKCRDNYTIGTNRSSLNIVAQIDYASVVVHFDENLTNYLDPECGLSSVSIFGYCNFPGNLVICNRSMESSELRTEVHAFWKSIDWSGEDNFMVLGTTYRGMQGTVNFVKDITRINCNQTVTTPTCPRLLLSIDLFERFDGNSLKYKPTGDVIPPENYFYTGDLVSVCHFLTQNGTINVTTTWSFFQYSPVHVYLSYGGTLLSVTALTFTLITYFTFASLRKLVSSKLIMILCTCLLIAQALLMLGGFATAHPLACSFVAAISHFFWLSVFSISTSLAFDLGRTFGAHSSISISGKSSAILRKYLLVAFGLPLLIVGAGVAVSFGVNSDLIRYGDELSCWIGDGYANLVAFGGPVAVALTLNVIFFAKTVRGIHLSTRERRELREGAKTETNNAENLRIYIKISTIMGFTWLIGYVAAFCQQDALWYVFIILNSLQGVYIFFAFCANKRVLDLWCTQRKPSFSSRKSIPSKSSSTVMQTVSL
ncbi:uncharacterized protein [Diadema setosum]|uniref:uncharacterized protein n=1 Tax=Diadema setosum TaxID=31175 RepID=UPI003B3B98DC